MQKPVTGSENKVDSEGSHQAVLGQLLQRERSPEAVRSVEAILQDSHSIEEKIRLIRELDRPPNAGYLNRRNYSLSDPESPADPVFDESSVQVPYLDDLRRARTTIKRLPERSRFWHYLFGEFSQLKSFGAKSHIFSPGFLFLRLRFSPDLQEFLINRLQREVVQHLAPGLRHILEHSWRFLKKDEYNILNLLNDFVMELIQTNFAKPDYRSRFLIDSFKKLESLYLSLRSVPGGLDAIFAPVEESYKHLSQLDEKYPRLARYINMLFLQEPSLPSFANFILGANMIRCRRMVGFGDLIRPDHPLVISRSDWECPVEVYRRIRKTIWEKEQEIKPLLGYYEEIFRKVNYVPVNSQGTLDYAPLAEFWDSCFGKGDFQRASTNISQFAPQCCDLLLGPLRLLLHGEPGFQGGARVRLFHEGLFSADLFRIESVKTSLEKLVEVMPTFPRERFMQLKQSRRGSIPNEAAIVQKVSILLSAIRGISARLIEVMKGRLTSADSVEYSPPVDSLMVRKGGFLLPLEHGKINDPGCFRGKTPPEALHHLISLLLSLAVLLADHETSTLLTREKKLKDKIVEIGKGIHRLAHPVKYQQLREEFHLDTFGL